MKMCGTIKRLALQCCYLLDLPGNALLLVLEGGGAFILWLSFNQANSSFLAWVIPCEINTKNGHTSQISLKLRAHIVYLEE